MCNINVKCYTTEQQEQQVALNAQQPVVECDWQLLEWVWPDENCEWYFKFAWPMVYLPLPFHIPVPLFGCGYALLAYNVHMQVWGVLTIELLTLSCVTD